MEMHTAAIASIVTIALSIGGSWMTTKTDVAVNANDIEHINEQLDRMEGKLDKLGEHE